MKTLLLKIEYDGSNYHGWQIQPNLPTIQEKLELALKTIFKQPISTFVAGRTDAGVHAKGQIVWLQIPCKINILSLFKSLNSPLLPKDIAIVNLAEIPEFFNPKENIKKKYVYQIIESSVPPVLEQNFFWWIHSKLDKRILKNSLEQILGEHDFKNFQSKGCNSKSTKKRIFQVNTNWNNQGNYSKLKIEIIGSGFLRHMVRLIVGTSVNIAQNKFPNNYISMILKSNHKLPLGIKAPAHGLFLEEIIFEIDPFKKYPSINTKI